MLKKIKEMISAMINWALIKLGLREPYSKMVDLGIFEAHATYTGPDGSLVSIPIEGEELEQLFKDGKGLFKKIDQLLEEEAKKPVNLRLLQPGC